jgi:hypothetical protein
MVTDFMRILITIPHYYKVNDSNAENRSERPGTREERIRALVASILGMQQSFGTATYGLDHLNKMSWQAAPSSPHELTIAVRTAGDAHLLGAIPWMRSLYQHRPTDAQPRMLGFECHRLLAEARGDYDYYGFVEDDIVISDPLFFRKRRLFDRVHGPQALLQPNRYELAGDGPVRKLYVDYRIRPALTAPYQDVSQVPRLALPFLDETVEFERTTYPSAGCFFLSAEQLAMWVDGPAFLDGDISYMGPLDSAATLSVMKSFRIYKPVLDQAAFLEVLHASPRWIQSAAQQTTLMPRTGPFEPLQVPS